MQIHILLIPKHQIQILKKSIKILSNTNVFDSMSAGK